MKVLVTEEQLKDIFREEIMEDVANSDVAAQNVMSQFSGNETPQDVYNILAKLVSKGYVTMPTASFILARLFRGSPVSQKIYNLLSNIKNKNAQVIGQMEQDVQEKAEIWKNNLGDWKLVSNDVLATVYNAVPAQCNNDVVHTASMFKLNLSNVLSQRVIAMERTFMAELGLKYGNVVYIEGTGQWDGPWQIQDTMNKRFAGMHKIDILVPKNIKTGKWENVKLSIPANEKTMVNAKNTMAGSM